METCYVDRQPDYSQAGLSAPHNNTSRQLMRFRKTPLFSPITTHLQSEKSILSEEKTILLGLIVVISMNCVGAAMSSKLY